VRYVALAIAINTLAYSIVYPFLPIYLHSVRGIPMSTVGLVYPAMGLATIVGAPVAGSLLDRLGRRALLVGGPAARGLCFFVLAWMAYGMAPFWAFVAMLSCASLVGSFFRNAANAYVTDSVPAEERTAAFSSLRIGLNVGWMTGPALGAFLARTPFALLFTLTAVLCVASVVVTNRFCPDVATHSNDDRSRGSDTSFVQILLGDRELLGLMVLCLALFLSIAQFVSTLSIYATTTVGIARNSLGFLYTINGALVIVLQVPLNRLLGAWNLRTRIAAGAMLYVVAYLGIGLSTRWIHLALCIGTLTIGEIFAVTAVSAAVSHLAPADRVGRYMGILGLVQGLGWAVGPYLGSVVFASVSANPLLLWALLSMGALTASCGLAATRDR